MTTPIPEYKKLDELRWNPFIPDGDSDDLSQRWPDGTVEQMAPDFVAHSHTLRKLYPELANWGFKGLNAAWDEYLTSILLVGWMDPFRDEGFLGYIVLRGIGGYSMHELHQGMDDCYDACQYLRGEGPLPDKNRPVSHNIPGMTIEKLAAFPPGASPDDLAKIFPLTFKKPSV